jgi:hypothetical protein
MALQRLYGTFERNLCSPSGFRMVFVLIGGCPSLIDRHVSLNGHARFGTQATAKIQQVPWALGEMRISGW